MGRLKNLKIGEFSLVRGSDKQPANPEAVTTFFKSADAGTKDGGESTPKEKAVGKETQAAPAQQKTKSLAGQIADTLHTILKGQTRTSVSTYTSRSESTDTIVEDTPAAEPGAGNGTTTVIITDGELAKNAPAAPVAKTAPAAPVAKTAPTEAPAADPTPGIADVVAALEPITKAVTALDGRLAAIESRPVGSQRLKAFTPGAQVIDNGSGKFPEFSKFLASMSGLTPGQKLTKATLTTSGWSYGLTSAEANAFIDFVIDESNLLKQIRTVRMPGKKHTIDKIGLGGNVLVKGTAGTDPGDTVSLSGPTQLELVAEEILAIVSIGDDVLEDNIEGEAFVQHLLKMIGASAANEIEAAAIHGDTAVADAGILDRWDGFYKLAKAAGAHVIEGMTDADRYWPGANGAKGTKVLKAIPTKYRQDYRTLAWIMHNDLYLDYNDALSEKGFSEAWQSITGMQDLPLRGIKNVRVPRMSTSMSFTHSATPYTDGTFVMCTDLRNLILGIHREIKIEPQRNARKRATDYVLSMRAVPAIENADAIGIYDHAKVKA